MGEEGAESRALHLCCPGILRCGGGWGLSEHGQRSRWVPGLAVCGVSAL